MSNCIKCGISLPENALFCHICGKKQVSTSTGRSAIRRGKGEGSAYKRGKTWEAAVVLGYKLKDGKAQPVRRTKGGFKTKKEALEYIPILRQDRCRSTPTINDLWYRFQNSKQYDKLSDSRKEKYSIVWRKIESETFVNIDILTVSDLQKIVDSHANTYYPARDLRDTLSKLYQLAIQDQFVTVNLAEYIELPPLNAKEREAFTQEDITKLWNDYLAGNTFTGNILLMIYSGCMPSELLGLRKDQIDWEHKIISGAGRKTKVRKETPIVLADCIIPVLADLCDHSNGDKVLHINKDRFYDLYYSALERAGCKRLPPYSARHTTASTLALENVNPNLIQRIMRHSRFSTTEQYVHIDISPTLAAVNKLHGAIDLYCQGDGGESNG
ncbi:MAG: hypothetical protein E7453_06215 [Ruminococcaceae bacterium]|nr:hypothetical protein [Oscillospiraceae bacterium]